MQTISRNPSTGEAIAVAIAYYARTDSGVRPSSGVETHRMVATIVSLLTSSPARWGWRMSVETPAGR